ncbi:MAG: single-stranded DNA-binding protein [Actinomycetaceae bacterium]|nr:single-stranded DNA-binding protein [Actinomycetaceae bacterium]
MSKALEVTIAGFVGSNPVINESPGTTPHVRFRLASTHSYKDKDGQWRDGETSWLDCKAWGDLARNVHSSVRKGSPVLVSGRLYTEKWESEKDGEKIERTSHGITATHLGVDLRTCMTQTIRTMVDQESGDGAAATSYSNNAPADDWGSTNTTPSETTPDNASQESQTKEASAKGKKPPF